MVLLYGLTYSSVPTSDGYQWVAHVDEGRPAEMLPGYHALPMYLVFHAKRLLVALGLTPDTGALIRGINALLAGAGAGLLCRTIVVLGGGAGLGLAGGGLLAVSFGYWYFANGELHHYSLVVLQGIFLLLVRARTRGAPPGWPGLVGLGLLNALAVLLHQENFLFGFAVVALLMVGRPWRAGLRDAIVYTVAGSAAMGVLAVAVGVGLRGVQSLDEWLRWFFWVFYAAGEPQPYRLGNALTVVLESSKARRPTSLT